MINDGLAAIRRALLAAGSVETDQEAAAVCVTVFRRVRKLLALADEESSDSAMWCVALAAVGDLKRRSMTDAGLGLVDLIVGYVDDMDEALAAKRGQAS